MKTIIIGIDGLETSIIEKYLEFLPNFKKIQSNGVLKKIETVFPADSVPAWNTIFTGLNPAEHGIVRGIDYVESVEEYEKKQTFILKGKTFWDKISNFGKRCLIINPFLAYPTWEINGIFESGPAFVEGAPSIYPKNEKSIFKEVLGGYSPAKSNRIQINMEQAYNDSVSLWKEYLYQSKKENFDLSFLTFTTLDRVQHYTWRFFDKNDPLHEKHDYLSYSIKNLLMFFDKILGDIISEMKEEENLIVISDHGFSQRPFKLINFNELLRKNKLLVLNENSNNKGTRIIQKTRTKTIKILSKLKLLDIIANKLKKVPGVKKYKKSSYLINKNKSICYVDELFCGKKPYCGINLGQNFKNSATINDKNEIKNKILTILNENNLPTPKWIKWNYELYDGEYVDHFPDLCFELPKEYGIEFDLFEGILTNSTTHYRLSGGHLNDGTYGFYSQSGKKKIINHISEFHNLICELQGINENIISK